MMKLACLPLLSVGILTAAVATEKRLVSYSPPACVATPRHDLLPKVIAPAAGAGPIWLVNGGLSVWPGAGMPVKTVWILDRRVAGALRVTGRLRQGNQSLTFRDGMTGPITSSFVIEAPLAHSMTPGGASAEVMRKFAFVGSYMFYPSPGCWEVDAQLGDERQRFVVKLD